ncbi:MAG TPA: nucleotide sugar dehydrogenase [Thermodesulfobacteriota bacterium]|nr:nucleotide sugar dehydrogenase [Thermodesulfobacteriota bacterium]
MRNPLYEICIVGGLGHVGLPLGLLFTKSGKRVVLYDLNQRAMDVVSQGKMPFMEQGAEKILQEVLNNKLFLSSDKKAIAESHFVIVCIGTPVDEHLNPQFTAFKRFFHEILDFLGEEQHIILRSTVFPGTTHKVKEYLETKGKRPKLSFCPERIAEGNAMEELTTLPQIISSFDETSLEELKELFLSITQEIIPLNILEAELTKLFTNAWRYIRFAIANQFYQIALQGGVNFDNIYRAMTHHYPRTKDFPYAGFTAGPCLLKDTMQLAAFSNNSFFLGHSAMLVNEGLPNFIVQCLKNKYPLKEKVVGILGMAFKADIDDARDSLSYKLRKILEMEAREVLCADPFVKDPSLHRFEEVIERSEIIIIGAPHSVYRSLCVDSSEKTLVDIWNLTGRGREI